jgi:hypothetical protein
MATSANSRLNTMNLRDRKQLVLSGSDSTNTTTGTVGEPIQQRTNESEGLKLTLPESNAYEPTNAFTSSRTQMRMLKVKIDKGVTNNPEKLSSSTV